MKTRKIAGLTLAILITAISVVSANAQTADQIFNNGMENFKAQRYDAAIADFRKYIAMAGEDSMLV